MAALVAAAVLRKNPRTEKLGHYPSKHIHLRFATYYSFTRERRMLMELHAF